MKIEKLGSNHIQVSIEPWSEAAVARLKRTVPPKRRFYNPQTRVWICRAEYREKLEEAFAALTGSEYTGGVMCECACSEERRDEVVARWAKRRDEGSCNFCHRGESEVLVIQSGLGGGLLARICRSCLAVVKKA